MSSAWHENRFVEDARKLRFDCISCGRGMWFPKSKHGKYQNCSAECTARIRATNRKERERLCSECGAFFVPRSTQLAMGQGRFCSIGCGSANSGRNRPREIRDRVRAKHQLLREQGKFKIYRGAENPRWKGGKAAYLERLKAADPIARAAKRRAYLHANPEKSREWRSVRKGRRADKLPRGTIKSIGVAQRWKCAICTVSVKAAYHADHIMPLALGGKHEPRNIQLLCQSCNLTKSAKHPVDYMQQRGFLL